MLALLIAASSHAQTINLTNNSFEADAVADGAFSTTLTGWTKEGTGTSGTRDPNNADYAGTTGDNTIAGMSGFQILSIAPSTLLTSSSVTQSTGISITAGTTYTLTVAVGNPLSEVAAAGTISLFTGATTLATSAAITPGDGLFQTVSTTFTAGAGNAGQILSVRLNGAGLAGALTASRVDFDNVTLTAVPEPSSLALIGMAGSAIWIWRGRRRRI